MLHIDLEHPDYTASKAAWRTYRHLYAGGEELRANASLYLERRQKEGPQVYQERLSRVFYENYVGSIVDWYAATLFRREPILAFEGRNEPAKRFFSAFAEDCDLRGSSLSDFFRRQLVNALVYGRSYTLVDFPRSSGPVSNRAEEDARGRSRAYLVGYTPEEVINWSRDTDGSLEWAVTRTSRLRQASPEAGNWLKETTWVRYDRHEFRTYRRIDSPTEKGQPALVDQGNHALANQNRVPLLELEVSEGLWLMNKAALLQLEHFNKSNALSWALTMGLFAMPVIYSERSWSQVMGESYYIQLGPGDRFGYTEPEGRVYQIAADNLVRLKDEIYRVCYLLTQAGGSLAGGQPQSGLSKQRDYTITQEVLRAYGDAVKDAMRRVLRAVEAAREDGLVIDVSGLDEFDIGDFSSELEDARGLLSLGIGSPTLRKQVLKKLALKYLCDVRQGVKDRIANEIDAWCDRSSPMKGEAWTKKREEK